MLPTLLLLLGAPGMAATPFAGVEYRPFSRADLTWVDDGRTSGLSAGEHDGFVRPGLQAFGGAWFGPVGVQAGLGIARLQNTTWVDDIYTQRHWGVVRPSLDVRVALTERRERYPVPWLIAGVHADVPSARDTSDGYTEEEQEAADETATVERIRLGGLGARVGAGVDYRVLPGLALGAMYTVQLQRSLLLGDDPTAVTSWVVGEAALLLVFEWPGQRDPQEADGD